MKKILLRPHHLICMHGFVGNGYSDEFAKHFAAVICQIKNGEAVIQVTHNLDDVCSTCPNVCHTVCDNQKMVEDLDKAYEEVLAVHENELLMWDELLERIRTHLTIEKFHEICPHCSWKQFGYCEKGLKRIIEG